MACKCNKQKLRAGFYNGIEELKKAAVGTNFTATTYYKAGLTTAEDLFRKLWQEHMEEDDA